MRTATIIELVDLTASPADSSHTLRFTRAFRPRAANEWAGRRDGNSSRENIRFFCVLRVSRHSHHALSAQAHADRFPLAYQSTVTHTYAGCITTHPPFPVPCAHSARAPTRPGTKRALGSRQATGRRQLGASAHCPHGTRVPVFRMLRRAMATYVPMESLAYGHEYVHGLRNNGWRMSSQQAPCRALSSSVRRPELVAPRWCPHFPHPWILFVHCLRSVAAS